MAERVEHFLECCHSHGVNNLDGILRRFHLIHLYDYFLSADFVISEQIQPLFDSVNHRALIKQFHATGLDQTRLQKLC